MEKDVYFYEYMDDWKKSNETLLLEKEDFYSYFNNVRAKGVCKEFEIKHLGEYLMICMFKVIHYC